MSHLLKWIFINFHFPRKPSASVRVIVAALLLVSPIGFRLKRVRDASLPRGSRTYGHLAANARFNGLWRVQQDR